MDHLMDLCTQSNLEKILKAHPSYIALHDADWSILSPSHSLKDINPQNIPLYTSCILLFALEYTSQEMKPETTTLPSELQM